MVKFCLGQCGYDLYAEIHRNYVNQQIHGVFMPMVVYGTLIALPALCNRFSYEAIFMQLCLFSMYLIYYLTFDVMGALMSISVYTPFVYWAMIYPHRYDRRWYNVSVGMGYMVVALVIQEIFGHTLFEGANSDLSQVPNNILIAPIFGARSIFQTGSA